MEKRSKKSGMDTSHAATGKETHSRIIRHQQAVKVDKAQLFKRGFKRVQQARRYPGNVLKVAAWGAVQAHSRMNGGAL